MSDVFSQLLATVPEELRRRVTSRIRPIRVAKGRMVLGVGARTDEVLFIIEGEASVTLHAANGREISIRKLGPGDLFGDLAAVDGLPRAASVVAKSEMRLNLMSRGDFLDCLESSPTASMWFSRRLVSEVRRLTEKVFELSALNVQARLLCELLRLARTAAVDREPAVTFKLPTHLELANRIAAQREAVSREFRGLRNLRLLETKGGRITIPSLERLEQEVARVVVGALADPLLPRTGAGHTPPAP